MKKGIGVGVLFIVIGLLFLLNNLELLDISIGDLIRVYWPLILIWLGVDKLLRKEKRKGNKKAARRLPCVFLLPLLGSNQGPSD